MTNHTDMVPQCVLAGQHALEQTFLVAPEAMMAPQHAPLTNAGRAERPPPALGAPSLHLPYWPA